MRVTTVTVTRGTGNVAPTAVMEIPPEFQIHSAPFLCTGTYGEGYFRSIIPGGDLRVTSSNSIPNGVSISGCITGVAVNTY